MDPYEPVKKYYDSQFFREPTFETPIPRHYTALAADLRIRNNFDVLDVACGTGTWLRAVNACGAKVAGIDISEKALEACRKALPHGEFHNTPAEKLPFTDNRFDLVSCFGALEHFLDPEAALCEMQRVAKHSAKFIFLVPNSRFLTRQLGLFRGTEQREIKEHVRSMQEWSALFAKAGLEPVRRWKDLHVLSWSWIKMRGLSQVPVRTLQAVLLLVWPLSWQYQIYYLCRKS